MASLFLIACPLPSRLFLSSSWTPTVKNLNFHQLTLTFFESPEAAEMHNGIYFPPLDDKLATFFLVLPWPVQPWNCNTKDKVQVHLDHPGLELEFMEINFPGLLSWWKSYIRANFFFRHEKKIAKSKCKQNFTNFRLSLSF